MLTRDSPPVPLAWVHDLLRTHDGRSGALRAKNGERDRNHLLQPADGSAPMLLKVSHPDEMPPVADFQTAALRHVARTDPGLPVQRIVPTGAGRSWFTADPGDGRPRVVRLFNCLPGLPLPDAVSSDGICTDPPGFLQEVVAAARAGAAPCPDRR